MFTGVDFAGPLYVRDSEEKVWLRLFTCCVTRAVHLEIVPGLLAQTFILCFRFAARRGLPQKMKMVSDNAKTFPSGKKLILMPTGPHSQRVFSNLQLTWLEKAPWQGGFFERLIQSAKRCLKCTTGNSPMMSCQLRLNSF